LWWRISPGKSAGSSLRTAKSKIKINNYKEITAALISFIAIAFLNFALEYAITKFQENQVGLK
jgi:hypothetical protein